MNLNSKCKINEKVLNIVMLLVLAIYIMPFVISSMYTVYCADDFSNYNSIKNTASAHLWIKMFQYGVNIYRNWQGTYFAIFLEAFIYPIFNLPCKLLIIRLIASMNVLCFFVVLWWCIRTMLVKYNIRMWQHLFIELLIVVPLFSVANYSEIVYWITGQFVYLVPFILGIVTFCLFFKDSERYCEIACFCGFLSVGGSLQIAGIITYIAFAHFLYKLYFEKKLPIKHIKLFLSCLLGSIINAIAPGNYVRRTKIGDGHIDILKAIIGTAKSYVQGYKGLTVSHGLMLLVILCIIIGSCYGIKCNIKKVIVFMGLLAVLPYVAIFPVALGYGLTGLTVPNRIEFICNFIFIVTIIAGGFCIGNAIKNYAGKRLFTIYKGGMCIALIVYLLTNSFEGSQYEIVAKGIINKELTSSANVILRAYRDIEMSSEDDVIVDRPNVVWWFKVSEEYSNDPEHWINIALKNYYKKESVRFR